MTQEKLTADQVRHEYDKIDEEHEDAITAADGRRAMRHKKLRADCPHPICNEFGRCPDCAQVLCEPTITPT